MSNEQKEDWIRRHYFLKEHGHRYKCLPFEQGGKFMNKKTAEQYYTKTYGHTPTEEQLTTWIKYLNLIGVEIRE